MSKKSRWYYADGEDHFAKFAKFADARRAALTAPWANGEVQTDTGRVCFIAPHANQYWGAELPSDVFRIAERGSPGACTIVDVVTPEPKP